MEMVGNGVAIDFAQTTFLRPQTACKVAEMIRGEGNVCIQRLTNGLAVIHRFYVSQ